MACCLQELAKKLIELVSVAPVEVQRDIITSLPEILEDYQHNNIARELKCVPMRAELWFLNWIFGFKVADDDFILSVALYSRRTLS